MSAWTVVISAPTRSWSAELPMGRGVVLGRAPGSGLEVRSDQLSDRHLSLLAREEGVVVEPLRGAGDVLLNDVPTSAQVIAHAGDELRIGDVQLIFLAHDAPLTVRPRVTSEAELMARLDEELRRAGPSRHVGLALIASPGINLSARQALTRRVLDEVQRAGAIACFAQLALDVLAVLIPELESGALELLMGRLSIVAGPRANVVHARSPHAGLEAHTLLGACWDQLLPSEAVEPLFVNPAMVRLAALVESRIESGASVCVVGPEGSGRRTVIEHASRTVGRRLVIVSAFDPPPAATDAWVLVRDVDRLTRAQLVSRAPRLATATQPPATGLFDHVIVLPSLRDRRDEVLPLAESFVSRLRAAVNRPRLALSGEARGLLLGWSWPGNVRELVDVLARAARITARDEIGRDALPERLWNETPADDFRASMQSAERELLLETLGRTRWNVTAAATRLGMPRRTIVHRMMKLGLKRPAR